MTDWAKILQPAVNAPPNAPAYQMLPTRETGARLLPVSIYVRPGSSDRALRVPYAEKLASTIFERAGVQIEWQSGLPKSDKTKPVILIEITSDAPVSFRRGALAYALPFEGEHIRIFWDRLVAASNDWILTSLVAHVMVDEITDVLQDTAHHSRQGIMKACWTSQDLNWLRSEPLWFNRADIDLIERGLTARRNGIANAASLHDPHPDEPNPTSAVSQNVAGIPKGSASFLRAIFTGTAVSTWFSLFQNTHLAIESSSGPL